LIVPIIYGIAMFIIGLISGVSIVPGAPVPSIDCGPAMADMRVEMVMNGPAPSMLAMLRAEAGSSPSRRSRTGPVAGGVGEFIDDGG
jgi:hypothetical protein